MLYPATPTFCTEPCPTTLPRYAYILHRALPDYPAITRDALPCYAYISYRRFAQSPALLSLLLPCPARLPCYPS